MPRTKRPVKKPEKVAEDDGVKKIDKFGMNKTPIPQNPHSKMLRRFSNLHVPITF